MSSAGTRDRILAAARSLLERDGYHGVAMNDVAREAGVTRQSVYLHFGSKAGLLLALVDWIDTTQGLAELSRRVDEAPTALQALDEAIGLVASYDPKILDTALALDAARRDDADAAAAWEDRMGRRHAFARRLAIRLKKEHVLRDGWSVDDVTDLIWTILSPQARQLLVERGWTPKRYARRMRQLLHEALTVRFS